MYIIVDPDVKVPRQFMASQQMLWIDEAARAHKSDIHRCVAAQTLYNSKFMQYNSFPMEIAALTKEVSVASRCHISHKGMNLLVPEGPEFTNLHRIFADQGQVLQISESHDVFGDVIADDLAVIKAQNKSTNPRDDHLISTIYDEVLFAAADPGANIDRTILRIMLPQGYAYLEFLGSNPNISRHDRPTFVNPIPKEPLKPQNRPACVEAPDLVGTDCLCTSCEGHRIRRIRETPGICYSSVFMTPKLKITNSSNVNDDMEAFKIKEFDPDAQWFRIVSAKTLSREFRRIQI